MKNSFLKETQRFSQPLLWIVLLAILGYIIKIFYNQQSISNLIPIIIILLLISFFLLANLKYVFQEKEIIISFFPFFKEKKILKEDISEIKIVKYKPLSDFGGWGIRKGFNKITAYNVKGNRGIYLELKNGEKYLLGTQFNNEILLSGLSFFFNKDIDIADL